jgi:hypothetical protein
VAVYHFSRLGWSSTNFAGFSFSSARLISLMMSAVFGSVAGEAGCVCTETLDVASPEELWLHQGPW